MPSCVSGPRRILKLERTWGHPVSFPGLSDEFIRSIALRTVAGDYVAFNFRGQYARLILTLCASSSSRIRTSLLVTVQQIIDEIVSFDSVV